jgi:DNA-directed RNA polymerase
MRAYTNEEFHKMHATPLLSKMRDEVSTTLKLNIPDAPDTGVFDINSVLDAEYFFQ